MFYSVGYFTGIVSLLAMAGFVAWAQPRRPEARLWAMLSLLVAVWFLGRFMILHSVTEDQAFFWQRIMYVGAIYLNVVYYQFVCAFIGRDDYPWFLYLGYAITTVLTVFNLTTHLFVKTMSGGSMFNFYEHGGPLYPIHVMIYLLYPGLGIVRLAQARLHAQAARKNKIDYILVATSIGFVCGATTIPLIFGFKIPPVGGPFVPIYAFIVAYAIGKHQLLDIKVVIRKTLLYSLISASLAAVYVGTITLLAHVLGERRGSTGAISSVFAAVFMTLLFNPLRIRLQRWLDRQFPRERLDPALLQEAAGGFAHEMKRPLSKISLPAELALQDLARLRTGELSLEEGFNKMEERLKFIMHQSVDAGTMIEAIRELSTASTAANSVIDLGRLLEETLHGEKELFLRYGVSEKLSLSADRLLVSGHAKQLKIVFINLMKNAAEAMEGLPPGKARELQVRLSAKGSQAIVDFKDTGPGIKAEDIAKLFQPHYTTKGPRGTGIGLYLSHNIILAHGGTIQVESAAGEGCVFRILFPLATGIR